MLVVPDNEAIVNSCVCVYKQTRQWKAKTLMAGHLHYMRKKKCKNLGVKKGEGI